MTITLNNIGKQFSNQWLFHNIQLTCTTQQYYAITGGNGSGKSTLLQIISGYITPTEGTITWQLSKTKTFVAENNLHYYIALASPALQLLEEFTVKEFLVFHSSIKPMLVQDVDAMLQEINLYTKRNTYIKYCSSGMKQRIKLALAFFSNTNILLLDEPTTNLDEAGKALYKALIDKYTNNRITIIASNDHDEYAFCNNIVDMNAYQVVKKTN
jgi:ABC-type multidrug transport system ATPase subunit